MAWTALTVTDVTTRLAGVEVTSLQTIALAAGQTDPIVEIIEQVTDEIRGYVGAGGYALGAAGTLPSKLIGTALAMIRQRVITRLPNAGLMDQDRRDEYKDAIRLLENVSAGKFSLEEPLVLDTETSGKAHSSWDTLPTLNFSLEEQDGI
jgi:phage gp36-like protein